MLNRFVNAVKRFTLVLLFAALQACSLLQPAPEIIDSVEPGQQPIAEALLDQYQQGLELMQQQAFAEARAHWQGMLGLEITRVDAQADSNSAGDEQAENAANSDESSEVPGADLQDALSDEALADSDQPGTHPAQTTPTHNQNGIAYLIDARQLPGVWLNLALSQYYLQQYQPGLDAIEQALTVNAEFCPAFKVKGLLERETGEFKQAEASYLNALACAPDDVDAHYNLGILYDLYLHDLLKALSHYQQADALLRGEEQQGKSLQNKNLQSEVLLDEEQVAGAGDPDAVSDDSDSEQPQTQQAFLTSWIADLKRRTKDLVPQTEQPEDQQLAQEAGEKDAGENAPGVEASTDAAIDTTNDATNNIKAEQVAGE